MSNTAKSKPFGTTRARKREALLLFTLAIGCLYLVAPAAGAIAQGGFPLSRVLGLKNERLNTRPAEAERTPIIVHSKSPHAHYVHMPDVVALNEQEIVIAWREERKGASDSGDVFFARSLDGGETWTRAAPLWSYGEDGMIYVNPVLHYDDGTVWAFVAATRLENEDAERGKLVCKVSYDRGKTWVKQPLRTDFNEAINIGGGKILRHGGTYLLPSHQLEGRGSSMRSRQMLLGSSNLIDWHWVATLPITNDHVPCEGNVVVSQHDPNRLVMIMRDNAGKGRALYSESDGGYLNWTTLQPLSQVPNHKAKSILARVTTGEYALIYCNSRDRDKLYLKTKAPHEEWSPGQLYSDFTPQDKGVTHKGSDETPSMDEYAPGKFFVTWVSDRHHVMFDLLDLDDWR